MDLEGDYSMTQLSPKGKYTIFQKSVLLWQLHSGEIVGR